VPGGGKTGGGKVDTWRLKDDSSKGKIAERGREGVKVLGRKEVERKRSKGTACEQKVI